MHTAIVIPARDEVETIGALLDDCAAQDPPADVVVVVDAGSTDGTAPLLAERARRWPALRIVSLPPAPPGRARNAGIEAAGADVIAMLDAGSRVAPGWLAAMTRSVAGRARTVAVGVTEADAGTPFERAAGWFTLRGFKPPDRPGPVGREFLPAGRNGLCLRRSDWQAAGGYDEDLFFAEDKLFLRRLRAAGAEVVVVPEAVVRWRPRGSLGALYRQYRNYGYGDAHARIDRQNELVPAALYATGALLALRSRSVAVALGCAYLGLFTAAAARELGADRALAWVPAIRLAVDIAKIRGFAAGVIAASGDGRSTSRPARPIAGS